MPASDVRAAVRDVSLSHVEAMEVWVPAWSAHVPSSRPESVPRIAYVVYAQRLPTAAPSCVAIRGFTVGEAVTEVPASAGDLLYYSRHDEGVREISLSPSGKYLLVAANNRDWIATNLNDLWFISVSARRKKALRTDNAGYRYLQWSSDESLLSYISNEGVPQGMGGESYNWEIPATFYIHDVKTGKRTQLVRDTFGSAWVPGHRLIVATSFHEKGLLLLQSDGKKRTTIRNGTKGGYVALSANGRRIAWNYRRRLRVLEWPASPDRMFQPDAWRSIGLFEIPEQVWEFAFSPDGKWLALLLPVRSLLENQLVILDPASGLARKLGLVNGLLVELRWSNSGEHLLFLRRASISSPAELWAVRAEKTSLHPFRTLNWSERTLAEYQVLLKFPANTAQVDWVEAN